MKIINLKNQTFSKLKMYFCFFIYLSLLIGHLNCDDKLKTRLVKPANYPKPNSIKRIENLYKKYLLNHKFEDESNMVNSDSAEVEDSLKVSNDDNDNLNKRNIMKQQQQQNLKLKLKYARSQAAYEAYLNNQRMSLLKKKPTNLNDKLNNNPHFLSLYQKYLNLANKKILNLEELEKYRNLQKIIFSFGR